MWTHIKQHKTFSLFCLFLLLLFCLLGNWQLHRYHFKKQLIRSYKQRFFANPVDFNLIANLPEKKLAYTKVQVQGYFLSDIKIFISKRLEVNKDGFELLIPLNIPNQNKLLLVNLGWVDKLDVPDITHNKRTIIGNIKLENEYQFILGQNVLETNPLILQKIDMSDLQKITHHEFYPYILLLDKNSDPGFLRNWHLPEITPERHLGYAIQWFLFALISLVGWIVVMVRK